ncbi:MAG: hypothetical protein ACR2LC_03635 [Pyrinomonadaceae bacterium]
MSEENPQRPKEANTEEKAVTPAIQGEGYEFILNRSKGEITLKDPSGQSATIKATVVEEEDEEEYEEDVKPLTPEEFQKVLKRVDELGLTWTADRYPRIKAKDIQLEGALFSEGFEDIRTRYPELPRELSVVVSYALTGNKAFVAGGVEAIGGEDYLEPKAAIARELIITPEYRAEFFFKHSIKVPYFESIDWEVVLKTHEKNVARPVGVPYALLLLTFHNTNPKAGKLDEHQNITVAVDERLIDGLMSTLIEVKAALENSRQLTDALDQRNQLKGNSDAL